MIKRLSHIAIWVTDMDRSLEFYLRLPGVEEQFRLTKDDGAVWLVYLRVAPGQFIELFPRAQGPSDRPTNAGYCHFCLEVDDIQELYRALLESGLTPRGEPKLGADGSWQLWIEDPDGNPIEFHQFTPDSMQLKGG
jgi:catechol 2,3-dioxygenase-like lactoylglutathione lyase family enzyme